VFSDHAYVVSPPTLDYESLTRYVDQVDDQSLRGEGMTAIGDRDRAGQHVLTRVSTQRRDKVVLVFTDGEYNLGRNPIEVLGESREAKIRVHVVGVDLEAEVLKKPAVKALLETVRGNGGRYVDASTERDLKAASAALDALEKGLLTNKVYVRHAPVFHWFALPAGLLLVLGTALRAIPYFANFNLRGACMCDQDHWDDDLKNYTTGDSVSRRTFGALSIGAGMAAALLPRDAAAQAVTEKDVSHQDPDGTCDAYFVHPANRRLGCWCGRTFLACGGVPADGQASRGVGYAVLVVNPFYRQKPAPVVAEGARFSDPETRKVLFGFAGGLNATTHVSDAKAFVAWLDAQPQVDKTKKIGTTGYCMGGPIVFRTVGNSARSRWRRGLIPRRRPGDEESRQPSPADSADEGVAADRDRRKRRSARAGRQERPA
jgi:hypothetical protein